MNSRHRPRVSLGDAVGPANTNTSPSLINIDAEVDDPLLSFASEGPPVAPSSTPERTPARFSSVAERPSSITERLPAGRLELATPRSQVIEAGYQRGHWAEPRPRGVGGSVVVAVLVLGIVIGFAGGYTSVLFNDRSPSVTPLRTVPARADEPAPFSAVSAGAGATNDAWEDLPVGTPSGTPAVVEPNSGTETSRSAPTPPTTIPVTPDVSPLGSIEVVSRPPGAEVALDGRVVGTTPVSIPDVIEGTHVVGIELAGFSRWATSVYVNKGERARVGASLAP